MLCHTAAENQMHSGVKPMRGMRHGDAGRVCAHCISKISEWQAEVKAASVCGITQPPRMVLLVTHRLDQGMMGAAPCWSYRDPVASERSCRTRCLDMDEDTCRFCTSSCRTWDSKLFIRSSVGYRIASDPGGGLQPRGPVSHLPSIVTLQ